jgi:hypothetical protein
MAEVIAHQADLHSATMDELEVWVEVKPDGKATVMTNRGMTQPLLAMVGYPVRVSLRMPYTPDNQVLRLTITRENPT